HIDTMARIIEVRVLGRIYLLLLILVITAICSLITVYSTPLPVLLLVITILILIGSRFERILFDGRRIARRGFFAFLEWVISGRRQELHLDLIEMITSEAIRSRRGLNRIKYRYRIMIAGGGIQFGITFSSEGTTGYRELIKSLLNSVD